MRKVKGANPPKRSKIEKVEDNTNFGDAAIQVINLDIPEVQKHSANSIIIEEEQKETNSKQKATSQSRLQSTSKVF